MKRLIRVITGNIILSAVVLLAASCQHHDAAIVPAPSSISLGRGVFEFKRSTVISVENSSQEAVARNFAALFQVPASFVPEVSSGDARAQVRLIFDPSQPHEGYQMDVDSKKITIRASDNAGFYYAFQTLRLSLPSKIDSKEYCRGVKWTVPAMSVSDSPRFEYRGVMIDVARYFMPVQDMMKVIDCMSMLKLNKLHLHLSDDNGWRLEIKKYPRLTQVGAWRVDRGDTPFPDRRNPSANEPTPVGGFYTQEQMKEIIAYAAERQVEIIPEIDMPAHSNAALASYPEFACPTVKKFIGVLPGIGGSNADIIYCVGNDRTLQFVRDILEEVMDLFPSRYMHLGGDEAWKTHWKTCPLCQARIKKEGLLNEEELQGWFMQQMNQFVMSKGKTMMGWDEVTNSKIPQDAVIFGWQGYGNAALKAAAQGHRFVMTPARVTYLIRYQGPQWLEPLTYFGNNTLKDIYDYEPVAENWSEGYEDLLMGIQGSLWTEFCNSTDDATYLLFPRLAAVAERAWCHKGYNDWNGFLAAVDKYNAHLDEKGVVYAKSMYNIQHTVRPSSVVKDAVEVTLECIRPDVRIRYTTDGTEPTADSAVYSEAIIVTGEEEIRCATFFDNGEQAGKTLTVHILHSLSTGKDIIDDKEAGNLLTNGVRGSLRQSDFEWCNWGTSGRTFVVDLKEPTEISSVTVGCLTNYGMAIHKPKSIRIEIADRDSVFRQIAERKFTPEEIFMEGNFVEDVIFDFEEVTSSQIRISLEGAGNCPQNHLRPGQESRMCIDEVLVK